MIALTKNRQQIKNYNGESGFGAVGFLIGFFVAALIVVLFIKVFPSYYDNFALNRILRTEVKDARYAETPSQIRGDLKTRLSVAYIHIPVKKIVVIKEHHTIKLTADYHRTIPLFYNISLYIHFIATS